MWVTKNGLAQETVIDPHTGLKKVVSVKISGNSKRAEQEAFKKLEEKIQKMSETHFRLSYVVDLYLKEEQSAWKPSSYLRFSSHFKSILQIVGDGMMDSMTAGYIRQKLAESGKSNRTINDYQRTIKTFWRWAYKNDYVKSQEVADKLMSFRDQPKKERIQDKYLEQQEVTKLLSNMREKKWELLSRFLILTGMRLGEAIALNRTDVWGDMIRINKTYDHGNKIITTPKSLKSRREIHIQPELKECIEEIRKYEKWQRNIFAYKSDLFFPNEEGTYLDSHAFQRYVGSMTEEVLGRRLTPHAFRHTHCSLLCAEGMTLDEISVRLGHEDSKITREIYFHRTEELKKKENEKLDRIRLIT